LPLSVVDNAHLHKRLLSAARSLGDLRRKQKLFFGQAGMFSDPAWDILLSIFIDEGSSRPSYVKSVTVGAELPDTTALEWIRRLEHCGLIVGRPDPADRRRRLLSLTPSGRNGIVAVLLSLLAEVGQ